MTAIDSKSKSRRQNPSTENVRGGRRQLNRENSQHYLFLRPLCNLAHAKFVRHWGNGNRRNTEVQRISHKNNTKRDKKEASTRGKVRDTQKCWEILSPKFKFIVSIKRSDAVNFRIYLRMKTELFLYIVIKCLYKYE